MSIGSLFNAIHDRGANKWLKFEIRNPKFETLSNEPNTKSKTHWPGACGLMARMFLTFEFKKFGFVSEFDIRASNLPTQPNGFDVLLNQTQ